VAIPRLARGDPFVEQLVDRLHTRHRAAHLGAHPTHSCEESQLRLAWIDPITAEGPHGNRYDVPGGGVLCASTQVHGCFAETLARYRVNLTLNYEEPLK
jgi:hypothetical protein